MADQTQSEKIRTRLRVAADAVETARLPEDLRSAGFVLAYQELDTPLPEASSEDVKNGGRERNTIVGPLRTLAERLHVSPSVLERIADFDDDGAHLILQRRWLDAATRPAMRQLALLTTVTRQGAGLEEWTSWAVLRETCEDFGVYAVKHFSEEVRSIVGLRVRGSGSDRQVKATVATFEEAGELVTRLAEGGASNGS